MPGWRDQPTEGQGRAAPDGSSRRGSDSERTPGRVMGVEALVAETGARVIVQHELADYESLPRFPSSLR